VGDQRSAGDAGCADGLLAAHVPHVPPPPSGDTREPRNPKEAAASSACRRCAQRTPYLRHQKPVRVTGQTLTVASRTGAHPSRETGSRRGEPESPQTSCSEKERRSELESVGHRKRHSPPALSSEVLHVHLATPLPEWLFAEWPAAAADRLHGEDEARLRQQVAVATATPSQLAVSGVPEGRGGSIELVCARTRLLSLSLLSLSSRILTQEAAAGGFRRVFGPLRRGAMQKQGQCKNRGQFALFFTRPR
jgi:hypothetical protein